MHDVLPLAAAHARARRLAWAGAVPFVLGAALAWFVRSDVQPHVLDALSAWAATVAAFIGGVHWGFGLRAAPGMPTSFGRGTALAAVGCVAALMPAEAGLVVHGCNLVASYLVDRKVYPAHGAAGWLMLRFRLSAVAALACFLAAASR